MIRATFNRDGRKLVLLGITEENVQRLKKDQPILVQLDMFGIPKVDVCIAYGESEEDITKVLEPFIGLKTKVVIDPRTLKK